MSGNRNKKEMGPVSRFFFARLFPLPFLAVGIAITFFGIKQIRDARDSMSWPSIPGVVEFSSVEQRRNDNSTTYEAEVMYNYKVNGVVYSSNRLSFGQVSSSDPTSARKIVNRYPVDSEVTVYYQENAPEKSVLMPGLHTETYFVPVFGLVFALAGLAMFIFLPRVIRKPGKKPTLEPFKPDLTS